MRIMHYTPFSSTTSAWSVDLLSMSATAATAAATVAGQIPLRATGLNVDEDSLNTNGMPVRRFNVRRHLEGKDLLKFNAYESD